MLLHDESPEAVEAREQSFVLGTYARAPFHPRSGKGARLMLNRRILGGSNLTASDAS